MSEKTLTVIEQRDVQFYGDDLTAARLSDGHIYASVRHMCDALGLNMRGQVQRIRRNGVLADGEGACILHTPGGPQTAVMLRTDLVALWLAGISTRSIKDDETRAKLERFQRRAAAVLHEAFTAGALSDNFDDLLNRHPDEAQALKIAQAVVTLARQQLLLRAQVEDNSERLTRIEALLSPHGQSVTDQQAQQISEGVRAIAYTLSERSGRNEYGPTYGELYRRWGVTSYKLIPAGKFTEVMAWLRQWWQTLNDGADLPF